jgi:hypothetical protein
VLAGVSFFVLSAQPVQKKTARVANIATIAG